ncbi:hypothetical protein [Fodinicola acaciae]|uniref:hypothetical protein n=1 Tax=Fodinicola acaciae TaxID=2681555 RepID=UPI0013D1D599|nr:hypothetical protein [Fodinicola acaciae]
MSRPAEALPPGDLDELHLVLVQHRPHGVQVGTRTCSYCGGVWDSAQLGDGPGFINGCVERLDAQLALAEVGLLPDSLIAPRPVTRSASKFLRTYK